MSRISELPRRDWRLAAEPYIEDLSAALREEGGAQTLRPIQAATCLEAGSGRHGVFIQGRMGVGKTLALTLLPLLLKCERPLIVVPGGVLKEVEKHIQALRVNWKIPVGLLIMSFTALSRFPKAGKSLGELFGGLGPDGIFPDECDKLANVGAGGAGVARLIEDWMIDHPETFYSGATGTCDLHGMRSYAHQLIWALRDRAPVPTDAGEREIWARVIDDGEEGDAAWVGEQIDPIGKPSTVTAVRRAYRERLRSTPGVLIQDDQFTDVPHEIEDRLIADEKLEPHFQKLRDLWQRPDDLDIPEERRKDPNLDPDTVEGSIWFVARRMARGLCYLLDPPPPLEWRQARRAYYSYARTLIESGAFYTEGQVRDHAREQGERCLQDWAAIAPIYDPKQHQVTAWLSTHALEWCQAWGEKAGLIWVDDTAFGVELARRTGWPYFGGKGLSSKGLYIEDADGARPAIASRKANGWARNLQYQWNRQVFTCWPAGAAAADQNVARIHREGQRFACTTEILVGCSEDRSAILSVLSGARRTEESIYTSKVLSTPWKHLDQIPKTHAFR